VDALDQVKVEFMLPEGAIICADNRRVLHGRTGFLSNMAHARALNRMYVKGRAQ
jgi:alpha-ketoglutarate-dependent taurine dioxygenase